MDKIVLALKITDYAKKQGISIIRFDDSCISYPILYCSVTRNGRTDADIIRDILKYKELFSVTNLKIRFKVI